MDTRLKVPPRPVHQVLSSIKRDAKKPGSRVFCTFTLEIHSAGSTQRRFKAGKTGAPPPASRAPVAYTEAAGWFHQSQWHSIHLFPDLAPARPMITKQRVVKDCVDHSRAKQSKTEQDRAEQCKAYSKQTLWQHIDHGGQHEQRAALFLSQAHF